MRLWHYDMLNVLPKQQLLSQLRECVAISKDIYEKGITNHILINPIMDYHLEHFRVYCKLIVLEMLNRGYNVSNKTLNKLKIYIDFNDIDNHKWAYIGREIIIMLDNGQEYLFEDWHNNTYLTICFYNLYEKYLRGGIPQQEWDKIENKYKDKDLF